MGPLLLRDLPRLFTFMIASIIYWLGLRVHVALAGGSKGFAGGAN
jgi:hypothetical protein